MTAHPAPAVARLGGAAPAHRGAAEPPYIYVRETRTAGWQVVYRSHSGHDYVLGRRLSPDSARARAEAAQVVYGVPLIAERDTEAAKHAEALERRQ